MASKITTATKTPKTIRKSAKAAKPVLMTFDHAADILARNERAGVDSYLRAEVTLHDGEQQVVLVYESNYQYWVCRVGYYNSNERYTYPTHLLNAVGQSEDLPIWEVREGFPF
jgi:hypothetical protein